MAESANRELTPDEVAEVTGYQELGLALPEKYAGMITENTNGRFVRRFPTAEEKKSIDAAAKADADAIASHDKARRTMLEAHPEAHGVVVTTAPTQDVASLVDAAKHKAEQAAKSAEAKA